MTTAEEPLIINFIPRSLTFTVSDCHIVTYGSFGYLQVSGKFPGYLYLFPLGAPLAKEPSIFVDENGDMVKRLACICSHSSTAANSSKIR